MLGHGVFLGSFASRVRSDAPVEVQAMLRGWMFLPSTARSGSLLSSVTGAGMDGEPTNVR